MICYNDLPKDIKINNEHNYRYFQITGQIGENDNPQLLSSELVRTLYSEIISSGIQPVFQVNSLRFTQTSDDNDEDKNFLNTLKTINEWTNVINIPSTTCDLYFDKIYNKKSIINIIITGILENHTRNNNYHIMPEQELMIVEPVLTSDSLEYLVEQEKNMFKTIIELINNKIVKRTWYVGINGLLNKLIDISSKNDIGFEIYSNKNLFPDIVTDSKKNAYAKNWNNIKNKQLIIIDKCNSQIIKNQLSDNGIISYIIGKIIIDKNIIIKDNENKLHKINSPLKEKNNTDLLSNKQILNNNKKINNIFKIETIKEPAECKKIAYKLLNNKNISSKSYKYRQLYSLTTVSDISSKPLIDAELIKINDENNIFIYTEGNSEYFKYSISKSIIISIIESARKIACSGGIPQSIIYSPDHINLLNINEIEKFENDINKVAKTLGMNVIKSESILYNINTDKRKKQPSYELVILVKGMLTENNNLLTFDYKKKGDLIYMIGETKEDISSSQYLINEYNIQNSPIPYFNIDKEAKLYKCIIELNKNKLLTSAHSVSKGGLFVSMVEASFPRKLGFDITTDCEIRTDAYLFGESQGRVMVSVSDKEEADFIDYLVSEGMYFTLLGHVTKGAFRINDQDYGDVNLAYKIYFKTR